MPRLRSRNDAARQPISRLAAGDSRLLSSVLSMAHDQWVSGRCRAKGHAGYDSASEQERLLLEGKIKLGLIAHEALPLNELQAGSRPSLKLQDAGTGQRGDELRGPRASAGQNSRMGGLDSPRGWRTRGVRVAGQRYPRPTREVMWRSSGNTGRRGASPPERGRRRVMSLQGRPAGGVASHRCTARDAEAPAASAGKGGLRKCLQGLGAREASSLRRARK